MWLQLSPLPWKSCIFFSIQSVWWEVKRWRRIFNLFLTSGEKNIHHLKPSHQNDWCQWHGNADKNREYECVSLFHVKHYNKMCSWFVWACINPCESYFKKASFVTLLVDTVLAKWIGQNVPKPSSCTTEFCAGLQQFYGMECNYKQDSRGGYHNQLKTSMCYRTDIKLELTLTCAPSLCYEITDNLGDECLTDSSCV